MRHAALPAHRLTVAEPPAHHSKSATAWLPQVQLALQCVLDCQQQGMRGVERKARCVVRSGGGDGGGVCNAAVVAVVA